MRNKPTLIILLTALSLLGSNIATASQKTRTNLGSSGRIKPREMEAYLDEALSIPLYGFNWGDLYLNDTKTQLLYVYNPNNEDYTLSLIIDNWYPKEAENYLFISWNREGYTLPKKEAVNATISIFVSDQIVNITDFAHNFHIEGASP